MISSARRGGLGPVRDAAAPFLDAAGYVPIRFEDETAKPVPSRAVCVDMVKRCDIYLLLLGAAYGDPMPDTGLSPTEEEWTVARNEGKPIVVFRAEGIAAEPRQEAFLLEVEAYQTGVFRGTFTDTADLLRKLKAALAAAAATMQPMRPRPLPVRVEVPWRARGRALDAGRSPALETHIFPIGGVDPLRAVSFSDVSRRLARVGRDHGLFGEGDPLSFPVTEQSVTAELETGIHRPAAGVSITISRIVSVWEALPTQMLGAAYDEVQIAAQIARDARLVAALDLISTDEVAIAVGIDRVDMLGQPTGPNSMTFPFMFSGPDSARLDPTDAYATASLARIAPELGQELAARLTLRLQRR